jgi:hypothetical protein
MSLEKTRETSKRTKKGAKRKRILEMTIREVELGSPCLVAGTPPAHAARKLRLQRGRGASGSPSDWL